MAIPGVMQNVGTDVALVLRVGKLVQKLVSDRAPQAAGEADDDGTTAP